MSIYQGRSLRLGSRKRPGDGRGSRASGLPPVCSAGGRISGRGPSGATPVTECSRHPAARDGSAAGRPPAAGPGREPQSSVSREARRPDGPRRRRAAPCSSRPRPQWRPRPAPPSARPQIQPAGPEVGSAVRTKRGGPRDVVSETASAGVRTQPRGTQGPGDSWRAGVGGGGGFSHCSRSDSESTRGP